MSKDNGGPAFPRPHSQRYQDDQFNAQTGMTLRDYMAIHASEGDVKSILECVGMVSRRQARYMHADAMLAERSK